MAAVRLHDRVGDGKAEPRSLARLLRREERREEALHDVVRNAGAGVGHAQMDMTVEPRGNRDVARAFARILRSRLRGIRDQIEDDLLQAVPVAQDLGKHAAQLPIHHDVVELQVVGHERQGAAEDVIQIHQRALSGSFAREGEQVPHDAARPLRLLLNHLQVTAVLLPELLLLEQKLG